MCWISLRKVYIYHKRQNYNGGKTPSSFVCRQRIGINYKFYEKCYKPELVYTGAVHKRARACVYASVSEWMWVDEWTYECNCMSVSVNMCNFFLCECPCPCACASVRAPSPHFFSFFSQPPWGRAATQRGPSIYRERGKIYGLILSGIKSPLS